MERLQKVMAHAGVASRRKCEQLILEGVVTVNGKQIKELGYKVLPNDKIAVNGVPLYKEGPVYFLFNKPPRTISAVADDKGRAVVIDYFSEIRERIYPIGRLDYDTTGLLLLTNDGEFAQMLMHPKYHIEKTYVARVKGIPEKEQLTKLRYGVTIDGKKTSQAKVHLLSVDKAKNIANIEITIHEGWNHQVKKMFMAVGLPVLKLKRERFGFLTVDNLALGQWRVLKKHEVNKLKQEAMNNINN